jgi:hypothetical protein
MLVGIHENQRPISANLPSQKPSQNFTNPRKKKPELSPLKKKLRQKTQILVRQTKPRKTQQPSVSPMKTQARRLSHARSDNNPTCGEK